MNQTPIPCRLEPRQVARIWGRRWLQPIYAASGELPEPVGEVWLSGEECRFADGPFAGQTLGEAWRVMPEPWKGARLTGESSFPILAKFLFPDSTLSIQVHPGDAYAKKHEAAKGGRGKTEMWYAVAARPGAEVLVGLKGGMDEASLRRALAEGTLEAHLLRTSIGEGDTIFVPAGTVHTIGPGVVLCEIQESSDLTYRLFDYNRTDASGKPRELHVEKALDVIDLGQSVAGKTRPATRRRGPVEVAYLAACAHFATERWRLAEPAELPTPKDHFDLLIFLDGTGAMVADEHRREYRRGEAWFVPADAARFRLEPAADTTLLRAYVPDLGALARGLAGEGMTREEMAGFLFK
jgi:mannose-6-phosphate isomerase